MATKLDLRRENTKMDVDVTLSLVEIKQIVESLRYEVRVSNYMRKHRSEYANHLIELSNRLEKIMIYHARKDDKVRCEQP